jgi:hypothetical protein
MMSFPKSCLSVAVVAASTLAGTLMVSAPAHALSIGSKIEFGWKGVLGSNSADFKTLPKFLSLTPVSDIGFGAFLINEGEGDFASFNPTDDEVSTAVIKDLGSTSLSDTDSADDIADFITFGSNSFKLSSMSYFENPDQSRGYLFKGIFQDGTLGEGSITTQFGDNTKALSYSGSLFTVPPSIDPDGGPTPVPTPALLPGLLGMGVMAMRKRKAQAQSCDS